MFHVLQTTSPTADAVLRGMFAARKSVFVDLLKWEVPVIDGAYEIDQFDDAHATYLILTDPAGRHLGSTRLLPTMRPHILDSLYGQLCEEAPPRGPGIYEITSEVLTPRRRTHMRHNSKTKAVTRISNPHFHFEFGRDEFLIRPSGTGRIGEISLRVFGAVAELGA